MVDIDTYRIRIGCFCPIHCKSRSFSNQKIGSDKVKKIKTSWREIILCALSIIIICLSSFQVPDDQKSAVHSYSVRYKEQPSFHNLAARMSFLITKSVNVVDNNFEARYKNGNIQKQKGIVNMHLNVRSLQNKVVEVKRLIKDHNPHIFGISEAELYKDRIDETILKIPGYNILFPQSWSQFGYARTLVYVKKTFKCQQVHALQDGRVQSVWLKGGYRNCKDIYFCHAYREHLSKETSSVQQTYLNVFLDQWDSAVHFNSSAEPNEVHVSGDLNIDVLEDRWLEADYPLLFLSRLIQNACYSNNFHQLVKGVTRVQQNSVANKTEVSCLDHIYTNCKFRCSSPSVVSFGDSDHDLIKYTRYSKLEQNPVRVILKRSYKNFDKNAFLQDVSETDWSNVYWCIDVNTATDVFTQKFKFILNKHAPWTRVQQRKCFAPWLTKETKNLMEQRDHWKSVAKGSVVDASQAWSQYKLLRNKINNRKKREEHLYKAQKLAEVAESSDMLWKSAKNFMGWKFKGTPSHIKVNDDLISSARVMAQRFNEFFVGKVASIRSNMPPGDLPLAKLDEIMLNKNCKMGLNHVSLAKVKKIIKGLSCSKSTGIDELDSFSVKLAVEFIAQPIHHIICLSINQSKFPDSWKFSKLIPLYKKGDKLERKNYRPVSILSPISKVLEKIIYEQIYSYFTRNALFHPNLHGYRSNRSTQTALLQMYDRWVRASHEGKLSGVVLLDLSAAFDLVDPELLLKKLKIYGFDDYILQWLESYLSQRYQAVWIDNSLSSFLHCPVGVPQGSNLGPLLFLVFYNDLPFTVTSPVDVYADDSTMTVSGDALDEIGLELTEACGVVSQWMQGNRLKLNPEKTHLLTVGTGRRLGRQESQLQVTMDSVKLQENVEKHELLLGCFIEPNLKWHQQVSNVLKKLQLRLYALEKLKCSLPFEQKKIFHFYPEKSFTNTSGREGKKFCLNISYK